MAVVTGWRSASSLADLGVPCRREFINDGEGRVLQNGSDLRRRLGVLR